MAIRQALQHSSKFMATQVMPMSRTVISVMRHCRERRFMLPRVHISALRKKLRAVLGYDPIRNRIGEGYLMGGDEE